MSREQAYPQEALSDPESDEQHDPWDRYAELDEEASQSR